MAKKKKERRVDFSQEEMIEKTKIESRTKFKDTLERVCEMYDIDPLDFKVDETNKKSGYFFTPECSELLALLIRHHSNNPLSRKNPDKSKITATSIGMYNNLIINDIDTELNELFRNLIYTRPAHMVSQEVADWSENLVKQLTYFLINITTLENENVGSALEKFTKELDEMNYCLFRGNYIIQKVIDTNDEEINKEQYEEDDEDNEDKNYEINKILNKQNMSIDKLIANMIKFFNVDAKDIRESGFPDLQDILEEKNKINMLLGLKQVILNEDGKKLFEDIKNPSDEELRAGYYELMIKPYLNEVECEHNKYIMNEYRNKTKKWKSIIDKILDDNFREPYELTIEEKKEVIKQNIEVAKKDIIEYQKELEMLEHVNTDKPKNEFLQKLQNDYVEYCKELDKKYKDLYNIVDVFIGQALNEFIK